MSVRLQLIAYSQYLSDLTQVISDRCGLGAKLELDLNLGVYRVERGGKEVPGFQVRLAGRYWRFEKVLLDDAFKEKYDVFKEEV